MNAKDEKYDASHLTNRLFRNASRQHASAQHGQTGAYGMAETAANGYANGIFGRRQRNGGNLTPIAPFGEKCQC